MCNNKSLPPKGYAEKLLRNLALVDDPNADLDSETDVETVTRNNLPIDNDFLARETRQVGEIGYNINVLQTSGVLVNRSVSYSMDYEYDEIFKAFMPRRADRPSNQPTEPHREFIKQRLDNVHSRRCDSELALEDITYELGDLDFIPQASMCFTSMIRSYLPAKLDHSSWVGAIVKQKLIEDGAGAFNKGELLMWQHWMGRGYATQCQREQARQDQCLAFTGSGGEGRLVCREDAFGVHTNIRPDIEVLIWVAEQSLVSLSIQTANWLAWCIYKDHAEPMARIRDQTALTSGDIIQAVVEILGDSWFELPFDDAGLLKEWKLKRAFPCHLREYLNVVDDHQDVRDEEDNRINGEEGQSGEENDESSEYGSSNYLSDDDF
jgi:hypothetical protein